MGSKPPRAHATHAARPSDGLKGGETQPSRASLSTGIRGLDDLLEGLRPGDNVVFHTQDQAVYRTFVESFGKECRLRGIPLVYLSLDRSFEDILGDLPQSDIIDVAAAALANPTGFADGLIGEFTRRGPGVAYVSDSLAVLRELSGGEDAACSLCLDLFSTLFALDAVAYWFLPVEGFRSDCVAAVRDASQVFLELWEQEHQQLLRAVKVWGRYSPRMYDRHRYGKSGVVPLSVQPVPAEALAAELRGKVEELVEVRDQMHQTQRRLEILRAIAENLNRTSDLLPMLDGALGLILDLMALERGWIFLLDEKRRFYLAAARGLAQDFAPEDASARSACHCEEMLLDGELVEPVNIVRCERWKPVPSGAAPQIAEVRDRMVTGDHYHASVPLRVAGQILGVMNLARMEDRPLGGEDLTLLSLVGETLSAAVQRARLYRNLLHLATTDGLTGIHNRRHLFHAMEKEQRRFERFGHPFSIILVDLDGLKSWNDQYGHLLGDSLLRHVAQGLVKAARDTDTVGRYGGDEFVVLLPETDKFAARETAERLCALIRGRPYTMGRLELSVQVTASFGVATYPEDAKSLDALLEVADAALYQAKARGGDRVAG